MRVNIHIQRHTVQYENNRVCCLYYCTAVQRNRPATNSQQITRNQLSTNQPSKTSQQPSANHPATNLPQPVTNQQHSATTQQPTDQQHTRASRQPTSNTCNHQPPVTPPPICTVVRCIFAVYERPNRYYLPQKSLRMLATIMDTELVYLSVYYLYVAWICTGVLPVY